MIVLILFQSMKSIQNSWSCTPRQNIIPPTYHSHPQLRWGHDFAQAHASLFMHFINLNGITRGVSLEQQTLFDCHSGSVNTLGNYPSGTRGIFAIPTIACYG